MPRRASYRNTIDWSSDESIGSSYDNSLVGSGSSFVFDEEWQDCNETAPEVGGAVLAAVEAAPEAVDEAPEAVHLGWWRLVERMVWYDKMAQRWGNVINHLHRIRTLQRYFHNVGARLKLVDRELLRRLSSTFPLLRQ